MSGWKLALEELLGSTIVCHTSSRGLIPASSFNPFAEIPLNKVCEPQESPAVLMPSAASSPFQAAAGIDGHVIPLNFIRRLYALPARHNV